MEQKPKKLKQYLKNLCGNGKQTLIAVDQLVYTVTGAFISVFNPRCTVYADLTVSAFAYRLKIRGKRAGTVLCALIDLLFRVFESEHCKKAYESELTGSHLPPDMQRKHTTVTR